MANKKRALGRGLSALLENADTDITSKYSAADSHVAGSISEIAIGSITPNPFQPRKQFSTEALQDLMDSIKVHGVIQPVTVRKVGNDQFQLISGERRFRASTLAGLPTIPAYVKIANDQSMLEMALIENIQRENLDPIEIAVSYERLIKECNLTQEEMAGRVGKSRVSITNFLRLLKLPDEIKKGLQERKLSMGHARALLSIDDEKKMMRLYYSILENSLSVRKVEEQSKELSNSDSDSSKRQKASPLSFEEKSWVSSLSNDYATKIALNRDVEGKGKLVFHFSSASEMEELIKKLKQ
ncbi:ParB/RepB/Spo0J family partition protein [Salibacteraceae bacterium]|jgi:ParB family chromosome partitioning protein|nr:ParB/RepB/Spo0J family partition protein [Bacteroidota bacterium]MDB9725656.1 ParB/RepB/Spo0J family partition protein [Salibacteraceae bacterium]